MKQFVERQATTLSDTIRFSIVDQHITFHTDCCAHRYRQSLHQHGSDSIALDASARAVYYLCVIKVAVQCMGALECPRAYILTDDGP